MCEVQTLQEDLAQMFTEFREQRCFELLRLFGQVRSCDCDHQIRVRQIQKPALRLPMARRKLLAFCVIFLLLLLLLALMWIYTTRRYNQVAAMGSGACASTILFTHNDCDIYA
ncbi:hypothetical protein AWZ03_010443 [Drosophila navojoa]|uniref:Uncharacterized protein n=1 Tax=Drosophila navojoa TaxID=7232 RepID=A0A484B4A2_DRONA|nr:uncharacterized protein LOC115563820 [Drosophila navojoa]TDG43122.1 hypothetical protein AWZ03_010443 [Drosophila navojoa]